MIPPRGRLVFTTPRGYSDAAMPTTAVSARAPSLTERLVALPRRAIPEGARARAALHVLDCIGRAIVDATTAPGLLVADWDRQHVSGGRAHAIAVGRGEAADLTARWP
jgi:hypothetical protein